jgi:heptosyltransferase II
MKILIELPSWLGDTVMVTPAIENILLQYPNAKIELIGTKSSLEALQSHPKVLRTIQLNKNIISFYNFAKKIGKLDIFISFRGSFRSRILKFFINSSSKYQFDKSNYKNQHQVEKYNSFICESLKFVEIPRSLILYNQNQNTSKEGKPVLGINPGAAYGSAKKWDSEKFAEVAVTLSKKYDIEIFGGPNETDVASNIERLLIKHGVKNYKNFSGKTSISELINYISKLDLFLTGDSGPMHIAASFSIPTVSIFGPTKDDESSQWMNPKSKIIKKNLECQPCMKRKCPLGHHKCMKLIKPNEVLNAIKLVN